MKIQYSTPPQEPTVTLQDVPLRSLQAFRKLFGVMSQQAGEDMMRKEGCGRTWTFQEEEDLYELWDAVSDFVDSDHG